MSSSKNTKSPQKPKSGSSLVPPNIPNRLSSKRPLQTNDQLDYQLFQTQRDFKKIKKELKPRTSFDSDYWEQAMQMASLGKTSSQIELHKAANNYVAAG